MTPCDFAAILFLTTPKFTPALRRTARMCRLHAARSFNPLNLLLLHICLAITAACQEAPRDFAAKMIFPPGAVLERALQ
jgi:hypothetical protein